MSMFGRRALSVQNAASDWWLSGGVSASNAIAVYQPIGAADLAGSYPDLSGNGNDAAPGVAPTWASSTGWTFNGSTQYLTTGVTPSSVNWSMLVRFSNATAGANRTIIGSFTLVPSPRRFYIRSSTNAGGSPASVGNDGTYTFGSFYSDGVLGIAGNAAYYNGSSPGTIATNTNVSTNSIYIGADNTDSGAANFNNIKVQAVAIYDTVLTADQVAAISTAMAALTG